MVTDPETAKEIAKAATAVAETTGKAIDAGRDAGGFLAKYIASPLEQGMSIIADKLKRMRWEGQVRFARRVAEVAAQHGLREPNRPLPLKLAIPLFQAAFLEDDETLQERWANLLLNATHTDSGIEVERAHVQTLEQLSSLEVKLLDKIYAFPYDEARSKGILSGELPMNASLDLDDQRETYLLPNERTRIALERLSVLGCLWFQMTADGGRFFLGYPGPAYLVIYLRRMPVA